MIIKIKSHKRPVFGKILEYILNDKNKIHNHNQGSFILTHNLKGNTIKDWETQFKKNELHRKIKRPDSVYLTHEILSWHKEDSIHLTLEAMEKIISEYLRKRNPKGIYVASLHSDRDHRHIHICASGIEYRTGKSMRLSKQEFQTLKKDIQQYQIEQFPEISKSIVKHGKNAGARLTDKEYQIKLRTGMATQKDQLIEILNICFKQADSKEKFFELLKKSKLKVYERGGKISGVHFRNNKFRFKRIGFPEERLEELNKSINRRNELNIARGNSKGKAINRNR